MAEPIVAIVGAGPAGLRAAEALCRAGLRPVLIDEAPRAGGQIYRPPPPGADRPGRDLYGSQAGKAASLHAIVDRLGSALDYRPETLAWSVLDGRIDTFGPEGYGKLRYHRLVLATGAMDRAIPFPGWTLPGSFTLGAAQIALKAQGVAIGSRIAFVGAGPLLPLVAHQYAKAGAGIAAILDVTTFAAKLAHAPGMLGAPAALARGLYYTAGNALGGAPVRYGVRAIAAQGARRVTGLSFEDRHGRQQAIACDAIAASFGLRSETQLADLAGCRFAYDAAARQWLPERSPEGRSSLAEVYLAGDGSGIGGADMAELAGARTACAVLADLGIAVDAARVAALDAGLARQARFRRAIEAAYPYPAHLVAGIADDEIVCRCEGITAGALRAAAIGRDATEVNRLKAFTRLGMGRCQGRVCGHAGAEILALALGRDVAEVGRLRGQPPVKPVPLVASAPQRRPE